MSEVRVRNPYETFRYAGKALFVEDLRLSDLADRWGTPLYVYSAAKIRAQFRRFDTAFASVPHTLCYALKANSNIGVVNVLAREGAGADIVSGGSWPGRSRPACPPDGSFFRAWAKPNRRWRPPSRPGS